MDFWYGQSELFARLVRSAIVTYFELRRSHEVHGCHFTGYSEMWTPCVWIWELRHGLSAVIHCQKKRLVVVTIRQFLDGHASGLAHRFGCDSGECFEVERDVALGHHVGFIADELGPSEAVELFSVNQAWHA